MTQVSVSKGGSSRSQGIKCPNCGSSNVHLDKKGFDTGNACCGALMCGPLGLLFGGEGSDKLKGTCLNCGKKFDVDALIKKRLEGKEGKSAKFNPETKRKIGLVLRWIFGVIFIILSVNRAISFHSTMPDNIVSIIIMLMGLLLIPPVFELVKKKLHLKITKKVK